MVDTVTLFPPHKNIYSISTKLLSPFNTDNLYISIYINILFISAKVKTLFIPTHETSAKQSIKELENKQVYK